MGAFFERDGDKPLSNLFPASYRARMDELAAPDRDAYGCIEVELDIQMLSVIKQCLWLAGAPMPPRSLHHQLLVNREITITERADLHLVCSSGRIFIKPVPRFLLDPSCWTVHLACEPGCECLSIQNARAPELLHTCARQKLRKVALGFLYSYVALISHESDYHIAMEKHLLPAEVEWQNWRKLVQQLDLDYISYHIDHRFRYGELQLSRLNKVCFLWKTPFKTYSAPWDDSGAFLRDGLPWLGAAIVYMAVALTAMQVGLATEALGDKAAFQSISYGFCVFSIIGPLIVGMLAVCGFAAMSVYRFVEDRRSKQVLVRSGKIEHCQSE